MTWVPLLLADPSPSLRLLVLRELLGHPDDDPEVAELRSIQERDPLVKELADLQLPDGSWDPTQLSGTFPAGAAQSAAYALMRLGYLGLDSHHPVVARAAEYLFTLQNADGSWPLPETYENEEGEEDVAMMPLQTALPLAGLAACGYAEDPRAEKGYEWLLDQRLNDGAWPTGLKAGDFRRVAGYRRLPHSRWGCRSNTTAALRCLAYHPRRRRDQAARRALDLLLGRETREGHQLGFEVARLVGLEPPRGYLTYYARFDSAMVLDLCWRIGAALEDERVADLAAYVRELQGQYGLWAYPRIPQAARWVTFDLLRSLSRLDTHGDWISLEPRTPFQPYPRKPRRY